MMKNKTYILTLSGLLLAGGLSAQTLSEAQKMFLNGDSFCIFLLILLCALTQSYQAFHEYLFEKS